MKYKVCAYVKGAMEGGIRTEKSRSNSVITDKSLQWDSGARGLEVHVFYNFSQSKGDRGQAKSHRDCNLHCGIEGPSTHSLH